MIVGMSIDVAYTAESTATGGGRDGHVTSTDGKLDQAAFMESCKADIYTMNKADAGAPLKGANSFTEGQAKDRVLSHGMTGVSALKKDDDGIWRGTAQQDGKPVKVSVDFKGNVVPQTAP